MKKLYYFSKSKLQYEEIGNFRVKASLGVFIAVAGIVGVFFGLYLLANTVFGGSNDLQSLKDENRKLKSKLNDVVDLYSTLDNRLDSLVKVNNELRVAANLPSISDEERQVGVGGGYFDNSIDFLKDKNEINISHALAYIDKVSRKISFEKNQYYEIEKKLKENAKLAAAMPAVIPCAGVITEHGFGMRMHPILHIMRMHEGIDIVTDIGTKVQATGSGIVDFVGNKGGFGLAIEIDHGFGYKTVYGHLSETLVHVNQKVTRGDLIAKTGNSGLSTGPHLHYEVQHNGEKIDPSNFFFSDLGFFEIKNNKYSSIKK